MPALKNTKHEIFAQELAKGSAAADAYAKAGYAPSRQNAGKLRQKDDISRRVVELLNLRADMDRQATEKATEALAIDKQWVISKIVQNAVVALGEGLVKGPVLCKEAGVTVVRELEYMDRDPAAANRALELLGKELGMFIDRSEISNFVHDVSAQPVTADEWAEKHGGGETSH